MQLHKFNQKYLCSFSIQAIGSIATIVLNIFVASFLSPEEFGVFAFFLSVLALASIFPMAGVPHLLQSTIPKLNGADEIAKLVWWCNLRIIKISFIVITSLVLLRFLGLLDQLTWLSFIILLPLVLLKSYQALLSGLANSFFKHCESLLLLNTLVPSTILLVIWSLSYIFTLNSGLLYIVYLCGFFLVVSVGILLLKEIKIIGLKSEVDYEIKSFSYIVIFQSLSSQIPIIWLNQIGEPVLAGNYRVAIMIATLPMLLISVINTFYLPKFSKLHYERKFEENKLTVLRLSIMLFIIFLPFLIITYFYSAEVVKFLFGSDYKIASYMLGFCIFGTAFSCTLALFPGYLNMTNCQTWTLGFCISSVLIGFLLLTFMLMSNADMTLAAPLYYIISTATFYMFTMIKAMFG
jgi:O-antigen/teichoic acid export membrane protein